MVVSIRNIGNISLSTIAFHTIVSNIASINNIDMVVNLFIDDLIYSNCNNRDKVRGHTLASSIYSSRTLSMFLSKSNEEYLTRVQHESNNMIKDELVTPFDSSQLEYVTPKSKDIQVSKVADFTTNIR